MINKNKLNSSALRLSKHGIQILRKCLYNIDFLKIINEILIHKKMISKYIKKNSQSEGVLNLMHPKYKEICKLLVKVSKLEIIKKYFNTKLIINSISAVMLFPNKPGFKHGHKWHYDGRYYHNNIKADHLVAAIPITLFGVKNGATKYKIKLKNKIKIIQPELIPSDVCLFDARIIHKSGLNKSMEPRVLVTIVFTPPHIKPIFNYKNNFINYKKNINKDMKQLLGFYSEIPKNLREFYLHPEKRPFRKSQMII